MDQRIGIVGAGLIGRSWAIVFARAGFEVSIYDDAPQALAAAADALDESLRALSQEGLLSELSDRILRRITPAGTLREVVHGAVLVQENVRETLEAKQAVFSEMDRLSAPETVLASSTSWLPASSFSESLSGRGRVIVAHPVNPPHLIPLVELAPAPWSARETIERAREVYIRAGQSPVLLKKEITGFLLNRIQGAVLNEALNLYEGGFASVDDIDKVMKHGLAMRWSFMGPFETIDLNAPGGVMDYAARYGGTYRDIARDSANNDWNSGLLERVQSELRASLPEADIERRTQWRDKQLAALVKHRARNSRSGSRD
jgi:3-hydroxyacyl-CoA dehydrogenase